MTLTKTTKLSTHSRSVVKHRVSSELCCTLYIQPASTFLKPAFIAGSCQHFNNISRGNFFTNWATIGLSRRTVRWNLKSSGAHYHYVFRRFLVHIFPSQNGYS